MSKTYALFFIGAVGVVTLSAQSQERQGERANPVTTESLLAHPLHVSNPRLYLVNWNNRALPAAPNDVPLGATGDILQRSAANKLAERTSRDGGRRPSGEVAETAAPRGSNASDGYLRIRSGGTGGEPGATPRLTTLISQPGSITEASEMMGEDTAKYDPAVGTTLPRSLAVILAIGGILALYYFKRVLED